MYAQAPEDNPGKDGDPTEILQGPKKLPKTFWGPFEATYTIILRGIWNHNIGNYLSPYNDAEIAGLPSR